MAAQANQPKSDIKWSTFLLLTAAPVMASLAQTYLPVPFQALGDQCIKASTGWEGLGCVVWVFIGMAVAWTAVVTILLGALRMSKTPWSRTLALTGATAFTAFLLRGVTGYWPIPSLAANILVLVAAWAYYHLLFKITHGKKLWVLIIISLIITYAAGNLGGKVLSKNNQYNSYLKAAQELSFKLLKPAIPPTGIKLDDAGPSYVDIDGEQRFNLTYRSGSSSFEVNEFPKPLYFSPPNDCGPEYPSLHSINPASVSCPLAQTTPAGHKIYLAENRITIVPPEQTYFVDFGGTVLSLKTSEYPIKPVDLAQYVDSFTPATAEEMAKLSTIY